MIKTGDIYQVGAHVVGCGDSTDQAFVSQVVGGHKINAIVTDPPYGVAYVENKQGVAKLAKTDAKAIKGDHLQSESEYADLTKRWLSAVTSHLASHNTFHIFGSTSSSVSFSRSRSCL